MKTTIAIITAIVMMVGMSSGMTVTMSGGNNDDTATIRIYTSSQSEIISNMHSISMDMSGTSVNTIRTQDTVATGQETHATRTVTNGHIRIHNVHINRNSPDHAIGTHIINIDGDVATYTLNGVSI